MSQRQRDLLILFGLALLVNGAVALLVSRPGYTDSYYYFNGGKFLADGQGLVEPYRWNYVNAPASLPAPGFDFWQPLPAFLSAAGIILFGRAAPFDSAQWVFVLVAACLPPLTYLMASRFGTRRQALIAGLLAVFSGYYVIYWSLPESFAPFALAGGGCLYVLAITADRQQWPLWLAAGALSGLAHLTRADGLLLLGIALLTAFIRPGRRWLSALLVVAGYLAVMAPWFYRNQLAFGSPLAPGGINAVWLTQYNDLFNYPQNLSAARFLASGWPAIIRVKLDVLVTNLESFVAVQNLIVLTPLTVIAAWRRWRDPKLWPALADQAGVFVAMTFVFSLPGKNGGYFHSAGALLPATFTLATLGLDDAIGWGAARRHWKGTSARRVFGAAVVAIAGLLTLFLVTGRVVGLPLNGQVAWNTTDSVYQTIGDRLSQLGEGASVRVMSNNPAGFYYFTGRGGMPVPNGGEEMLLRAAHDYQLKYLVLDWNVPDGLKPLYASGPVSTRLKLVETYGSAPHLVYLYRIEDQP